MPNQDSTVEAIIPGVTDTIMPKSPEPATLLQFPGTPRQIYNALIESLTATAQATDLTNDNHFHGLLWMITRMTPRNDYYTAIAVQTYDSIHDTERRKEGESKLASVQRRVKRWVKGESGPSSLYARQRIIAAALNALRAAELQRTAVPAKHFDRKNVVEVDVPKDMSFGLGSVPLLDVKELLVD